MPSSPAPTEYQRGPLQRFFYRGFSLSPQDALGEGKVARAENVRSRQEGEVTIRDGLVRLTSSALDGAANSLFRLNDPALLAGGASALRFYGTEAGKLYAGDPAVVPTGYGLVDDGFSGDPLGVVIAAPVNSPQPWAYVADQNKMVKVDAALNVRSIGLPPPADAAVAHLAANQTTFLQSIDSGTWVAYGGEAGGVAAAANARLDAIVNAAIYDDGADGMCSVALDDMTGVTEGATVALGGSGETVIVQQVIPAVAPTTIEAIMYDQGASGWCTIQPDGSFGVGATEAALPDEVRRRYYGLDESVSPRVTITRTVDYPVNGLVMLNGIELVRIQSVAIGPDGVLSFRAFCAGTYAAGQSITGAACFRCYTQTTIGGGDPAVAPAAENEITPVDADTPAFAGIQTAIAGERDWSLTGDRAMRPEDIITLGINVSALAYVEFVRLMLATNEGSVPAGQEFSRNYYQYEWRANDLLAALQASLSSSSTSGVASMLDAQTTAVQSGQTESFYGQGFGTEPLLLGTSPIGVVGETPVVQGANNIPIEAGTGESLGLQPRTDGYVTAGTAPSRQLALGNYQWLTLQCRVGDLLRVGTDPGRTLQNLNSAAVVLQVSGTASAVTVQYSDCYLTGGYGPDCGQTSPPYVWRYRYRSTATGERGNFSPSMRAGIPARRQRVELTVRGCTEAQCDVIDVFRFGGTLPRWTYDRSIANDVGGGEVTVNVDNADSQIVGGEAIDVHRFQPWPVADLPRSGTCTVVGTSVQRVSGDFFNESWAPDTLILVNGRATALYGSPASGSFLEVIDNCDAGDPVEWSIPSPTIMAQPMGRMFGGAIGEAKTWFHFAVGDPTDPGAVRWTHGNDPDASSDAFWLAVTTGTEPLQNGCIYDGVPYIFSTEGLYRLRPAFGSVNTFVVERTACKRGLWNPWAFCVGKEGIYFVAQDGIFLTQGGEERSITEPDLARMFPRDGSDPENDDGLVCVGEIDFLGPMKLTAVDQLLYFDYKTTEGLYRALVCEPLYGFRWTPDSYPISGARSRMEEPGAFTHTNVIGAQNGHGYQSSAAQLDDDGVGIPWSISTPWANGSDPRALKQWGDVVVEADTSQSCDGIKVEPVVDNGTLALPSTQIGSLTAGRQTYLVEVPEGGVLSRNFGLLISGIIQPLDIGRPRLFFWEPSWLWKQTPIARRTTDWEDLGYKGQKFVQGLVIRANTFGRVKRVAVEYDGGGGTLSQYLDLVHNGEQTIAYPRAAAGWTPFTTELVRLVGADDVEWTLLDWRWVFEPAPELATHWETQETTFDFPGYGAVSSAALAYQSPVATTLRIWHGQGFRDYAIPSTGGVYRKLFLQFAAAKGLSFKFRWTGDQPFRVFQRDCSFRVTPWGGAGDAGGYTIQSPFGGPSRVAGAEL